MKYLDSKMIMRGLAKLVLGISLVLISYAVVGQSYWNFLNGPFGAYVSGLVKHSSGAINMSTNNGIWRSTNGGDTWTKASTSTDQFFYDLKMDASGNLFAITTNRLYKSTDGGVTWTLINSSINSMRALGLGPNNRIYLINFSNQLHRSTDGGTNFFSVFTFGLQVNFVSTSSTGRIFAGTNTGLRYSDNEGVTFNNVTGSLGTVNINSIAINATGDLFVLATDGPHKSTAANGGVNWTSIKGTIPDGSFFGVLGLDPSGNLYLLNGSLSTYYTSTNGGTTWSSAGALPTYFQAPDSRYPAIFDSPTTWFVGTVNLGVYKTVNSGSSFSPSNSGVKNYGDSNHNKIFLTSVNGRLLMAGSHNGMYLSVDDGNNWTLIATGAANRTINGFVKLADNSILAYGDGVIRSTDNGATWTLQSTPGFIYKIVTSAGTNLFYMDNTNIYKSVNNGVAWTPTALSGLPAGGGDLQIFEIDNSEKVYIRWFNNSVGAYLVYKIDPVTGVGTSMTAFGQGINDISIRNNVIFVLRGSNNLLLSTDGGTTASTKTVSPPISRIWTYDQNILFAMAQTSGSFNVSFDGGTTWSVKTLNDNNARVTDFNISSNFYGYAATSYSVLHKSKNVVIPPVAPTNLVVKGISFNGAQFLFDDNSNNEDYFIIEQSVGNNLAYDSVGWRIGINNAKYTFQWAGLDANTTYFFRVRAYNGAAKTSFTNEVSFTTLDNCVTTIPDNRSWTAVATADLGSTASGPGPFTSSTIRITRNGTQNFFVISDYELNVNGFGGRQGIFDEGCGSTMLNWNVHIPNGNGTWNGTNQLVIKYQNDPFDPHFQGTTTLTLNPTDPVPATPSINGYLFSSTEALINWNQVGFETEYVLQRSTTPGSGFATIATIPYPTIFYIDKNLTTGTTYYYRISSKNSAGTSVPSGEISIQLQPVLFRPLENLIAQNFENQQGVSFGDLDGDGLVDIASPSFVNSLGQTVPPVFYKNLGAGQFERKDLAVLANENSHVTRGLQLADFNNDGKLDVFLVRSGTLATGLLLINDGNWNFTKTVYSSIGVSPTSFTSAAIADYDKDGFVDVLVGRDNQSFPPNLKSLLLKNNAGTSLSIVSNLSPDFDPANSKDVSWVDYDNDGDQDAFVINWSSPALPAVYVYRNNNDGTFTKITGLAFDSDLIATTPRTMSWGDIDNDQDLDLYLGFTSTSPAAPDRIYRNNGDGTFTNLVGNGAAEIGSATYGSAFGDIDNDGDLDLFVSNSGANAIFRNDGSGNFTKYTTTSEMIIHPGIFNIGVALADVDNDGFLDVYPAKGNTSAVDLPNLLYKNTMAPSASRNWIKINLVGTVSNKSAIGARIKVVTTSPARTQIRSIFGRTGYGSQNDLTAHFGLGSASTITTLEVKWPNGGTTTLTNVTINQTLTIVEDFTGPVATTRSPANNATNANTNTTLAITLDETHTGVAGKFIHLYRTSDLVTPVFSAAVTSATVVGNTHTFALPSKLDLNTSYSVVVEVGAFLDAYNNASLVMPAASWQFLTDPGPTVTTLLPAHNSIDILESSSVSITFNKPVTAVAAKKIKIAPESNPAAPIVDVNVTTGTITGNTFTFTPSANLPFLTPLLVTVDAGAFVDLNQNDFAGMASGSYKFTIREQPDVTQPSIVFAPPPTLAKGFSTSSFEVTATDNKAVTSVTMFYRKVTATTDNQISGALNTTTNKWDVPVVETSFDDMGMEYYFEARDAANNMQRSPTSGYHITRLKFSDANTSLAIAAAGNANGYRIVGLPFVDMPSNQISVLLDELGAPDATKYRLLKYQQTPQAWIDYPNFNTVTRGEGYFIVSRNAVNVKLGEVNAPNNSQSNLFVLNLKQGWNMISNPYTVNVSWSETRTGITGVGELKVYSNGSYTNGDLLNIFQGGFVLAASDVSVPVKLKTSATGGRIVSEDIGTDLNSSTWILPINLHQNDRSFKLGGIGMHPDANSSVDNWDDFAPPSPSGLLEIKFAHPEHFMKKFSRDVVKTSNEQEWTFEVESDEQGFAYLSWERNLLEASTKDIILYDVAKHKITDMKSVERYTFETGKSTLFKVYFGDNLKESMKPLGIHISDPYPNPSNSNTTIEFGLPEGLERYGVNLSIVDFNGKNVETLYSGNLAPGFHKATWEAGNNSDGMYVARLVVSENGRQQILTTKILLKR